MFSYAGYSVMSALENLLKGKVHGIGKVMSRAPERCLGESLGGQLFEFPFFCKVGVGQEEWFKKTVGFALSRWIQKLNHLEYHLLKGPNCAFLFYS